MKIDQVETAIFYITNRARALADKIKVLCLNGQVLRYKAETVQQEWNKKRLLIFITAIGIAVRSISSLIQSKKTDPAVLVIDEEGKYVISLLSGHLGGANAFAREIAMFLNAQPIITTSSDINALPSIDLWALDNNLTVENEMLLPSLSTKMLNTGHLNVYDETNMLLPDKFIRVKNLNDADILITNKLNPYLGLDNTPIFRQIILRPKNLVLGLGCNSGTPLQEIESVVLGVLNVNNLSFSSICCVATIDIKASERGIVKFREKYNFEIKTFSNDDINKIKGIEKSEAVFRATGAYAVAEPCALLASGNDRLLFSKQKVGNVTVAGAETKQLQIDKKSSPKTKEPSQSAIQTAGINKKGKIYIVGTGPGSINHITPYAVEAIKSSHYIVGYDTYLELIDELIKDQKIISTGMTQEIERCKKAIQLADEGWTVSVISGGDPGIYAMAGLVFELLISLKADLDAQNKFMPDIEVVPGISALNAAASRLGAPLMHDFASISLSDRLTPWEVIAKRLDSAAYSDFVIVLYNPKSKGRTEHINIAASIIKKHRSPDTPVGIVKQAMRDGERVIITTLKDFLNYDIDMQTTVIIGNSMTFVSDRWMVTPRGYKMKENIGT